MANARIQGDYCDVYLTHDSMSVRKAHNSGRNHLRNVVEYYQQIGHEKAQSVIDSITASYTAEGQASQNPMLQPPPMAGPGGFAPPPFGFPPGGMPPPPFGLSGAPGAPAGRGMPNIPPNMPFPPPGQVPLPFPPNSASPPQGLPFPPPGGLPPNFQFPPNLAGQAPGGSPAPPPGAFQPPPGVGGSTGAPGSAPPSGH